MNDLSAFQKIAGFGEKEKGGGGKGLLQIFYTTCRWNEFRKGGKGRGGGNCFTNAPFSRCGEKGESGLFSSSIIIRCKGKRKKREG